MLNHRRKLLSQNFLKDRELVKKLVSESTISRNDLVVEIGAGKGLITEYLLTVSGKVIAIELDFELYTRLYSCLGNRKNIKLIYGDFRDVELPTMPYKVVANIPFSITGEIVKKLLFSVNSPEWSSLIVQKEAAEKFIVNRRKNKMLAILFYPWFDVKISHIFKRNDFVPCPRVDVCLLQIVKRQTPIVSTELMERYRDFVVFKFTKCRKAGDWQISYWLSSFAKSVLCRGAFSKWQNEQKKLEKIHRTRIDANWRKFGRIN